MANTIVWADIPVTDLDRAIAFYGTVLQAEIATMPEMEGIALLPGEQGEVSADLALTEHQKPGTDGTTIYLNSNGDPEGMLQRAEAAGGKILMPVTDMGPMIGSLGFFLDSEGNRIGVHKPPDDMG
jgi:predicted enzyme related to lactoylglutathione lyase